MHPKKYYRVNIEWKGEYIIHRDTLEGLYPNHFIGSGCGFNGSDMSFLFPNNLVVKAIEVLFGGCRSLAKKHPNSFYDFNINIKEDK